MSLEALEEGSPKIRDFAMARVYSVGKPQEAHNPRRLVLAFELVSELQGSSEHY